MFSSGYLAMCVCMGGLCGDWQCWCVCVCRYLCVSSFFSKPQAVSVCSCLQNGVLVYIGRVTASVVAFWGFVSFFIVPARTRICSNMYFGPQSTCVCV